MGLDIDKVGAGWSCHIQTHKHQKSSSADFLKSLEQSNKFFFIYKRKVYNVSNNSEIEI